MTQIPDIECWAGAAATELRRVADSVAAAPNPAYLGEEWLRFSTLADDAGDAIDRLTSDGRIDRDRCLYVFTLDDNADPEALKIAFSDARQRTDLKLPQDNIDVSNTLYVGSSCATRKRKRTLRNRLRQHLICAPRGHLGPIVVRVDIASTGWAYRKGVAVPSGRRWRGGRRCCATCHSRGRGLARRRASANARPPRIAPLAAVESRSRPAMAHKQL